MVVLTSLVWCMLDVWILTYYSGCADNPHPSRSLKPNADIHIPASDSQDDDEDTKDKSILDKVIDRVPDGR